jgi:hypothetical protein
MLRYLSDAFWARSGVPLLRIVPINVLAVAGIIAGGFFDHSIWFGGAGFEALYLLVLTSNPRFRQLVDETRGTQRPELRETAQDALLDSLGTPARQRAAVLQQKLVDIERLYRESQVEDYLHESNVDALRRMKALFIDLLVAERNIHLTVGRSNRRELEAQRDTLVRELSDTSLAPSLRDSKQSTLDAVQQRIVNLAQRDETLAQIDGDLARVEAQFALAVENATLRGKPAAISANLELVSQLVGHDWDPTRFSITAGTDLAPSLSSTSSSANSSAATTTSAARETER